MTWIVTRQISDKTLLGKAQFVADMLNASGVLAEHIGISPEAVTAQGAQESGWGASRQGRFGFFGQKVTPDWAGPKVLCRTREFINGDYVTEEDWFRDYSSLDACLADHFDFLNQNSRYRDAGVFDRKGDEYFFHALQKAGYATDPNYARNCMAVEDTVTDYFMPMLTDVGAPPEIAPAPPAPVLMIGSQGGEVIKLQTALRTMKFYTGVIDGGFGPLTYDAVKAFQTKHMLVIDGVVGERTRTAIASATVPV